MSLSSISQISSAFGLPLKDDGINALVKETQNCRAVLIGEMTHGSEEFYETRSQITKRVLENNEEDTWVVALEAGYAQVEIINDFVQGKREFLPDDWSQKFPKWLWRNSVCLSFFEWARNARKAGQKIQILGMDLYGMFDSIDKVVEEVTKLHDEKMLALVMKNYEQLIMLQKQGIEESRYRDSGLVLEKECEAVCEALIECGLYFSDVYANAAVVSDAEKYYRTANHAESWNVRDDHMFKRESFKVLENKIMDGSRIVVWAHNSHVLDYRATIHSERGEHSVGQLIREALPPAEGENKHTYTIIQSSFSGTVRATKQWGQNSQVFQLKQPASSSLPYVLHDAVISHDAPKDFVLLMSETEVAQAFYQQLPNRAIGVVYKDEDENISHYFDAIHTLACDAIIHIDETKALIC